MRFFSLSFAFLVMAIAHQLSAKTDTFLIQINYNNSCVDCLKPVYKFYKDQIAKHNKVLFYVSNLEPEYAAEYIQLITGLDSLPENCLANHATVSRMGITDQGEHTIHKIVGDKVVYQQMCVSFFDTYRDEKLVPRKDSFKVNANLSGLKFRDLYARQVGITKLLLVTAGYHESILLYDRMEESLKDVDSVNRASRLIGEVYKAYFGPDEGKKALKVRNASITAEGRLGSYKEFSLVNIKTAGGYTYIAYRYCLVFPDSTTKSSSLVVQYSNSFEITNFWVQPQEAALGHYYILLNHGDNYLLSGDKAILPVYYNGESYPDPAYNLAEFTLGEKHLLVFSKLLDFYEPVEKQKLLRTKMYTMFPERTLLQKGNSLSVIYGLLPFVYSAGNRIEDTLIVSNDLFLDPV